jgi:hypothetical protein
LIYQGAALEKLHQIISSRVRAWRASGYEGTDYPAVTEILEYQIDQETGARRFLRVPQILGLETYWYLRLIEGTPHIFDLYNRCYAKRTKLRESLGVPQEALDAVDLDFDVLWDRIKTDDDFVRDFKLESLRETLTLDYPSYILALAMGAGKTILIGSIIATEFSLAMEYPDGHFVQNALVFAPGKTIIESLRQLAKTPYDKILPPRLYKPFAANLKLTFTRDGDPDIPVIRSSVFNAIVTNTEKIRITKDRVRKTDLGQIVIPASEDDKARTEVANRRLQTISSLPHLAVFSDEAHHTYGQSMGNDLKRVRQTVDYLHRESPNLICVVNTTGTPFFQRQALKDVVVWYGLSQGIEDGILKDVANNIFGYDFDPTDASDFAREVLTDFFETYGDVRLPGGAPAKLAMYFPQNNDLTEVRPTIESALLKTGLSPEIVLRNISESTQAEVDAFNRLNDPDSPHRVILLVNKGTEGWDCPSLFSCALARRLRTSNNFVLQAATRCLRQVPGNNHAARIYLSMENRSVLDRQLQETYGETISDLDKTGRETRSAVLKLRKIELPPVVVTQIVRTVVPIENVGNTTLAFQKPKNVRTSGLVRSIFTVMEQHSTERVLQQVGDEVKIETEVKQVDKYTAAVQFAEAYRLDIWPLFEELTRLYGKDEDVPLHHMNALANQIEQQMKRYEVKEEKIDVALALVKPDGFIKSIYPDGTEVYTAEIRYPVERESLLMSFRAIQDNQGDFGFHYTPYNFDSNPEKSFFEQLLREVNTNPSEVEDIFFTGALTDPNKTDFFVEYKDEKGKWRRYTPDFIIRKKGKKGKCLIIEIKSEHDRDHPLDGENGKKALALRQWEKLNPNRLKYEMIFTASDVVAVNQLKNARDFVQSKDSEMPK